MSEFSLHRLTLDDLDALYAIECASFSAPWSRGSYFSEFTENSLSRYEGVFADGQLIAFAGVWLILDEAHICNVAVSPDWRRQGVGALLMSHMFLVCKAAGCGWMTLEARESNAAALALYEKLGFQAAGVRPDYYEDNGEGAVIMWKKL